MRRSTELEVRFNSAAGVLNFDMDAFDGSALACYGLWIQRNAPYNVPA